MSIFKTFILNQHKFSAKYCKNIFLNVMLIIIILITPATNATRIWMEMFLIFLQTMLQCNLHGLKFFMQFFLLYDFDMKCDLDMILRDPPTSSDCCNICLANLSSGFCHKRGFLLVYCDDTLMTDSKTYGFVWACCFCCS